MNSQPPPRWVGDNKPDLPPELEYAANLPPKITDNYVLFFGYEGPWPEVCLQQWFPSQFSSQGPAWAPSVSRHNTIRFYTSEQWMMYCKALLMKDETTTGKILACKTPGEAKALGREVKNFDQSKWDAEMDNIVEEGNWLKFSQNEKLAEVLLSTERRELIEASPNDRLWGVGFNAEEALAKKSEWGENKLGKALMKVRDRLMKEGL